MLSSLEREVQSKRLLDFAHPRLGNASDALDHGRSEDGVDFRAASDAVLWKGRLPAAKQNVCVVATRNVLGARERANRDAGVFLYEIPRIRRDDQVRAPGGRGVSGLSPITCLFQPPDVASP